MLETQTPPDTTESQRHSHGADKETQQIHIHVGTDTITCIRQPGSPGLAILKELLNTHNNIPAHLRGYINLEQEGLYLDSPHCGKKVTATKDPCALDWYFMAYCKARKCPAKAAKIKVGGQFENNGMLTLQYQTKFCDHTNEEARVQQRRGVSTAKRKRSRRIAARTRTTTTMATTTVEPQDSSCSPPGSPKLDDTDPPRASRVLDIHGEGGISTASLTKQNEVSSTPAITSTSAHMVQNDQSTVAHSRDLETHASSERAKRTRRTGRGDSEDATLKEHPTQLPDRPRRCRTTYRSSRHSTWRSYRRPADSSLKRDKPVVADQRSPCVQVIIPSFSRVKPEPSHDHADLPEHTSSVSSRANESRFETPPRSTDSSFRALGDASTDPSKDEVLKASDTLARDLLPSPSSDNTGLTIVKKEVSDDNALLQTSSNMHKHPAEGNDQTKHPSAMSKPPLENRTSFTINCALEPAQLCRTMDTQKRRSSLPQTSTEDSPVKEHGLSAQQQQPHEAYQYAKRSAGRSALPIAEPHQSKQRGLLTPTPSLTSFKALAQDPLSTSASYSITSPRNISTKPPQPPPPLTCPRTLTPSESGRLCSVSLRSLKTWLTQVPIVISPATTFEDLLQYVIQEVEDSIRLPLGMRWSIRSLDLSKQYLLNARVAETITGVEHAALVIMTEKRASLHLDDF